METSSGPKAGASALKPGRVRLLLLFLVAGFIGLFIAGELPRVHNASKLAAMAQEAASQSPDVTVVTPHAEKPTDLTLPGGIQAITEASINARTAGYLKQRFVDIGSHVRAGDLLAIIESPDLDQQVLQADAQTDQSKATVRQSQADVARQLAGAAQAEAVVAQQRAAVRQAQAMLNSVESKKLQAEAAEAQAVAGQSHTNQAVIQQRALLKQADAQLSLAKITNTRYQELVKQGFDTQQNADQAEAAYKTAQAAITSANAAVSSALADLEASKQAVQAAKAAVTSATSDVEAAKENLEAAKSVLNSTIAASHAAQASVTVSRSTVQANQAAVSSSRANAQHFAALKSYERIVAPFDGVITSRNVDVGALIAAGGGSAVGGTNGTAPSNGLFGIASTTTLRITVNVPQTDMLFVKPGVPADILVAEFQGKVFKGTVFQSAGALDSNSRTLQTEIHIPNDDKLLRPGMYATVRFHNPRKEKSITIPANTLIMNAAGLRVATVVDGKVHFVDIKVGKDLGVALQILQGLKGSETLISNPSDDLQEGESVHPIAEVKDKKP